MRCNTCRQRSHRKIARFQPPCALACSPVKPADPNASSTPEPAPPSGARRRATLATLLGLAAVAGPALAQMGGGGGRGMHGQQQDTPRPDKDPKDTHVPDASPPRDLVSAFVARLHDSVPELALAPAQQGAFRDFSDSLAEVGQHNERRMQRMFWRSAGTVSAIAPLKSFIGAEFDEGQGRQEALADLKTSYDKLDAQLDDRQRALLANLFVATRSDLQAERDR